MKAIILAAGLGERMRPLTNTTPKPMLPIADKPALEYTLKLLKKHGITDVAITTWYLKEKIINYFGNGKKLGIDISYLKEKELIPSARAVKQLESFIDDEIMIMFGDNLTDIDLTKVITFHKESKSDITLCTHKINPGHITSLVKFDKTGKVLSFVEKPTQKVYDSTPINNRFSGTGIYILKKKVFKEISEDSEKNVSDVIDEIYKKYKTYAYVLKETDYFKEIGNIDRYLSARKDIESGKVKLNINEKYKTPISFFIPAYNEEENLREVSKDILSFLENNFEDYEYLIVANKSKDKTQEIAKEIANKNKKTRAIIQREFVGYGTQLKTGWEAAKKDLIFYTDSDRQFNVEELHQFMKHINNHEIVIGYRKKRKDPFMRILYSWLYNQSLRYLVGIKCKDADCAFKLCHKKVIDSAKPFSLDRGGDAEFLVKSFARKYRVKELPVTHRPRIAGVSEAESNSNGFFVRIKPEIIKALIKETAVLRKIRADTLATTERYS